MGGIGSGGRRVGSGQKGKRDVVIRHPSAPASIKRFDPPTNLRGKGRAVWLELAPAAFEARTLTPATTVAFVRLCRAVVKDRAFWRSKWDACGPDHRGLMQRLSTWEKDFCLAPLGKPMYDAQPAAAPVSKWAGAFK